MEKNIAYNNSGSISLEKMTMQITRMLMWVVIARSMYIFYDAIVTGSMSGLVDVHIKDLLTVSKYVHAMPGFGLTNIFR